mgnify:CR=1 FL=1|jgi:hypothetical protein
MYHATGVPGWARYRSPSCWAPLYHPEAVGYAGSGAPAPYQWDVEDEVAFLQEQAEILQEELAGIQERLEELSKEKKDEKEDD